MPQFLSEDWITAARKIREELEAEGNLPEAGQPIRVNLDITGVPFGDGVILAHADTTEGVDIDLDHLEGADAGITLGYDVAKAIFIAGDANAAMQAFMAGQLKMTGDATKVMAFQTQLQGDQFKVLQERFVAITD